jgi:argininosuccinate synthase
VSNDIKKVVLAYSGGLDTSVIVRWLIEEYGCEVVCFAADLGQAEELDHLNEKAIDTGASKIYIEDLKEEFTRDFVFPMMRANAVYEGSYLLGTSIARPLISKEQIRIANKENADAVSHGATGKGNDQVRFELAYYALNPGIKVIAPWRDWDLNSRESLIAYAKKHNIPVPVTKTKPYSSDRNLLHISFEGGVLEDPWAEAPEDMYVLSVSPEKAPNKPTYIEIDYEAGNAVAVNGEKMSPATLLTELNRLGGENGIGRVDLVENRYVGMKSRGVYETPGGTILHKAHRAVESLTIWYAPERELLQKTIDDSQANVTGTARLKLYKGNCDVVGRKAEKSLFNEAFATFEADSVYNQKDAEGFIKINSLRLRIRSLMGL